MIRKMTEQDIARVTQIESEVHIAPWTLGIFNDCLRVDYESWVIEEENNIIGYTIYSVAVGEAHILNIAIDKHYQGQRFGKQLLKFILQQVQQQQVEKIFLEVRRSNHVAIQLYQGFGFKIVGERKNYYQAKEGREDAIILALSVASIE